MVQWKMAGHLKGIDPIGVYTHFSTEPRLREEEYPS